MQVERITTNQALAVLSAATLLRSEVLYQNNVSALSIRLLYFIFAVFLLHSQYF